MRRKDKGGKDATCALLRDRDNFIGLAELVHWCKWSRRRPFACWQSALCGAPRRGLTVGILGAFLWGNLTGAGQRQRAWHYAIWWVRAIRAERDTGGWPWRLQRVCPGGTWTERAGSVQGLVATHDGQMPSSSFGCVCWFRGFLQAGGCRCLSWRHAQAWCGLDTGTAGHRYGRPPVRQGQVRTGRIVVAARAVSMVGSQHAFFAAHPLVSVDDC